MGRGGIVIKLSGHAETLARLQGYAQQAVGRASAAGVLALGNAVLKIALPLTPKLSGTLRASGQVTPPVIQGSRATASVGMGGPAHAYAEAQHQGSITRGGRRIVFANYTEPGTGPLFLARAAQALQGVANTIFTEAFRAVLSRGPGGTLPPPQAPSGALPAPHKTRRKRRP